jgi:methylmalonyl-CoA mutase cobalamin-binding subunit
MIRVLNKKENDDDIKVAGGYITLEDFNKMKSTNKSRFLSILRKEKIKRIYKLL